MPASQLTQHPQVARWPHPAHTMASVRRLTALALARALLAGAQAPAAMAGRLAHVLGRTATWQHDVAARAAKLPGEHWGRLQPRTLADWI